MASTGGMGPRPSADPEVWQAAQEQLARNRQHATRNNTSHDYLLRGLERVQEGSRRRLRDAKEGSTMIKYLGKGE